MKTIKLLRVVVHNMLNKNQHKLCKRIYNWLKCRWILFIIGITTEAKTITISNLLPLSNTNSLTFIKHNSLTSIGRGIQESKMKTIKLLRVVVHNMLNKNQHELCKCIYNWLNCKWISLIIGVTTEAKTTTIDNLLPSSNTNSLTLIKHNSLTSIGPGIQKSKMKTIKLLKVVVHNN